MTDSASPRNPSSAGEPPDVGAVRSSGRRRLLQAGLTATPFALTLSSRPVLAFQCRSPSANASGNASHPGQEFSFTGTKTIAEWAATDVVYPNEITKGETTMGQALGGGDTRTVTSVVQSGSNFEKYMAAAVLNWYNVPAVQSCLTLAELKSMWAEGAGGPYSPMSGVQWDNAQIIFYLQSNYIVPG